MTAPCTEVGPGAQPGPAGGAGDQVVDSQAEAWRLEGGDSSSCRGPNAQETGCPWKVEQRALRCFLSTADGHRELTTSSWLSQCQGLGEGPQDLRDATKLKLIIDRENKTNRPINPSRLQMRPCKFHNENARGLNFCSLLIGRDMDWPSSRGVWAGSQGHSQKGVLCVLTASGG